MNLGYTKTHHNNMKKTTLKTSPPTSKDSSKPATVSNTFKAFSDYDSSEEFDDKKNHQVVQEKVSETTSELQITDISSEIKDSPAHEILDERMWSKASKPQKTKKTYKPRKHALKLKEEEQPAKPLFDEIKPSTTDIDSDIKTLQDFAFTTYWTVWEHDNNSTDWKETGYVPIGTIKTIKEFWNLLNNFHTLKHTSYSFFIMREDIKPIWEDPKNKNGGICSFRIDGQSGMELFTTLSLMIVNNTLTENINTINGISFSIKNNWCLVKIWNDDKTYNIHEAIPPQLIKYFEKKRGFSVRFKEISPEY